MQLFRYDGTMLYVPRGLSSASCMLFFPVLVWLDVKRTPRGGGGSGASRAPRYVEGWGRV